ncbi:hypothetical protein VspSTUT11_09170 [Vibrio sp. STUT-A11]|nr:hypothetical protein VspSTUT11_09170 [Vibrio sp. STUT-A11]
MIFFQKNVFYYCCSPSRGLKNKTAQNKKHSRFQFARFIGGAVSQHSAAGAEFKHLLLLS